MINAMQTMNVPYEVGYANRANEDLEKQAKEIAADLKKDPMVTQIMEMEGVSNLEYSQIVALIAYLQRIGTDIKKMPIESHPEH
jgi:cytochrome c oxidase cbb3-type subunit I/II